MVWFLNWHIHVTSTYGLNYIQSCISLILSSILIPSWKLYLYPPLTGVARLRCRAITFDCPRSAGGLTLEPLPRWDFLLCRVGLRAGLLPSACPTGWGLLPGLWKVKSHYPRLSHRCVCEGGGGSGYKWLVHNIFKLNATWIKYGGHGVLPPQKKKKWKPSM